MHEFVFYFICIISLVLFLILDRIYTYYKLGHFGIKESKKCIKPHPKYYHDFEPNLATYNFWDGDIYSVCTNNLGRRDKRVRNIPLYTSKPRVVVVGDSFTEGPQRWDDTFIGKVSKKLPQYDFINAGVRGYSPSTYYLLVKSLLLEKGLKFDEVIVFIDLSDIHNEATYYRDTEDETLIKMLGPRDYLYSHYGAIRETIRYNFLLLNNLITILEKLLVRFGLFSLPTKNRGNVFDDPLSAWTYKTEEELAFHPPKGYLPLGIQGGIEKAIIKMDLLKELLQKHDIPLSVAVYPWPAQILHNDIDSRQVSIWQAWCKYAECKRFINLFPDFFVEKFKCSKSLPGYWYEKLFIFGDVHYNSFGNEIVSNRLEIELTINPVQKL